MSVKTDKLKLDFTKLSEEEKAEVINFINDYQRGTQTYKTNLSESLKRSLGPMDAGKCACCGK